MAKTTFTDDQIYAINKIFYYIHNARMVCANGQWFKNTYVPNVIAFANFPCGTSYAVDKFASIFGDSSSVATALIKFYGDLDNEHREIMLKWISENYEF